MSRKLFVRFNILQMMIAVGIIAAICLFVKPDKRLQDQDVLDFLFSQGAFHLKYSENDDGRVDKLSFTLTGFDNTWFPEIKKLDALRVLELRGHKIDPYWLEHLSGMRLEYLDLRDTNLSALEVQSFQQQIPSCRIEHSVRIFGSYQEYEVFRQELRSKDVGADSNPQWHYHE